MKNCNEKICFILLPGFAPDAVPVLDLGKILRNKGYGAITSNFFGEVEVDDFANLTAEGCLNNITKIIDEAAEKYECVYGIGISLGGAFLLEYAKNKNKLDGIVSVGTPFLLKNKKLIKFGKKILPVVYPFWKKIQRFKKLRLTPIGAGVMAVDYLESTFLQNLEKIETPTLFMHSKKDGVTDYRALPKYMKIISNAKQSVAYFDNGNHVMDDDFSLIIEQTFNFFELGGNAQEECNENEELQASSASIIG